MSDQPAVMQLDEIEPRTYGEHVSWLPLRELGGTAFGLNVWCADAAGATVIVPHRELGDDAAGHEELYLVLDGAAEFTIGEETHAMRRGSMVVVPVGTFRHGVATEPGTRVLVVGGRPGSAGGMFDWEAELRASGQMPTN